MEEFILCAAIDYEGLIISGHRHSDCYNVLRTLKPDAVDPERDKQGFLTSENRFVHRKEAWDIAIRCNQVKYGKDATDNGDESILISENLY